LIAEADNQMLQWTKDVLGEAIASLNPPAKERQGRGVGIHLMEVVPEASERAAARPRLQLWLKYLITSWADSVGEAHHLLDQLFEAALQHPDFEVQAEMPSPASWQAFGVPPQPCLTLRTRAWKELTPKPVKLVRKTVFEKVLSRPLEGVVLGPEAIPIAEATVELPALHLSTRTDPYGQFRFANVPVGSGLRHLLVRAKGREMTVDLGTSAAPSPLAIQFEMEE
jgi:hypothetical protein